METWTFFNPKETNRKPHIIRQDKFFLTQENPHEFLKGNSLQVPTSIEHNRCGDKVHDEGKNIKVGKDFQLLVSSLLE